MGKTIHGTTQHKGNIKMLTGHQQKFLADMLGSHIRSGSRRAYKDFLGPPQTSDIMGSANFGALAQPAQNTLMNLMGNGTTSQAFQQGVVDPLLMQFRQQVMPAVQQRFVDANAGSSSALNQALSQGAQDLTTQIGSMYLPFMQNQLAATQGAGQFMGMQQDAYNQANINRMNALGGLSALGTNQTFSPMVHNRAGILGPLVQGGATVAGMAAMASSQEVKENIREYKKGLDVIEKLDVKIYDYIEKLGGRKDCVGVIAEHVPNEIQATVDGIRAVDLYGLIGLLINSVKELKEKVEHLEGSHA